MVVVSKFKTIYLDPPWEFRDKLDKTRKKPYSTLSIKELWTLPISSLCEDMAHIYLWVPSALLKEGIELMEWWGFYYKCHIVWLKRTKHDGLGEN